jgi:hypothetical protein
MMPTSLGGRLAASAYLLLVLCALLTWLIAGPTNSTPAFDASLVLTAPIGLLGYAVVGLVALALPNDSSIAPIAMPALIVVVFMSAAAVNVVAARGIGLWCSRRARRARGV